MTFQHSSIRSASVFFLGLAIVFSGGKVQGQNMLPPKELKEAARKLLEREQGSVVWVRAKVRHRKISGGDVVSGGDGVLEVLGTIVEESGLTVVSDTEFDPASATAGRKGGEWSGVDLSETAAEISFIEIVLSDDVTVPASIVYRDRELDLTFLKPDGKISQQRGARFRPVGVATGHSLEVMDDVIHVARLDASMDRSPCVQVGSVSAVARGSRTFYRTTSEVIPGTPVFCPDGALLGLGVHRIVEGEPGAVVTLSSETVKVITEIAEATGFLAARSEEKGAPLTEGLTLSLADIQNRAAEGAGTSISVPGAVESAVGRPTETEPEPPVPAPVEVAENKPGPPPAPAPVPRAKVEPKPELKTEPKSAAAPRKPQAPPEAKTQPQPKPEPKQEPKPEPEVVANAETPPQPGENAEEDKKGGLRRLFGGIKFRSRDDRKEDKGVKDAKEAALEAAVEAAEKNEDAAEVTPVED